MLANKSNMNLHRNKRLYWIGMGDMKKSNRDLIPVTICYFWKDCDVMIQCFFLFSAAFAQTQTIFAIHYSYWSVSEMWATSRVDQSQLSLNIQKKKNEIMIKSSKSRLLHNIVSLTFCRIAHPYYWITAKG